MTVIFDLEIYTEHIQKLQENTRLLVLLICPLKTYPGVSKQ